MKFFILCAVASALFLERAQSTLDRAQTTLERAQTTISEHTQSVAHILGHLPKEVSKAHEAEIITKLQAEEAKLQNNVKMLKAEGKKEKARMEEKMAFRKKMSSKDKKMWDQFSEWDHRMNQKSLAGARDILSKLKNAVHFIKKGALQGDAKAHQGLDDVVKQMSGYLS